MHIANPTYDAVFRFMMEDEEVYRPIIRRLRMASENEDIRIEMEMEDDYLKDLQDRERLIAKQQKEIEDKEKALEDRDKIIEDKEKIIEDKEKALADRDKTIEELKRQLAAAQNSNS
ncbi:MAG: hypothetical protein LBG47_03095 [Prevotellaceae bacterium]|jgi:beta-phosphoglucomutase-like phosphatase (HAD superfamily)|nr:hypothetical protein [Prevotellaceae bacterium]